ncbi:MAG: hypothetical protein QS748_03855 [Candidatus Endonucleobacter bathymodioli]|uniref:Uncharacterized protein n=1 Tax=Candidatus Endonucleibacter bathymodioli TaxID=539814 RepID=A0AA90SSE8_9GAMM|nr:hypothetical protein [Candidatus Endonucleobacter bathymodioli]
MLKMTVMATRKPSIIFSVHTGVGGDTLIHSQSLTPGTIYNSKECDTLLRG